LLPHANRRYLRSCQASPLVFLRARTLIHSLLSSRRLGVLPGVHVLWCRLPSRGSLRPGSLLDLRRLSANSRFDAHFAALFRRIRPADRATQAGTLVPQSALPQVVLLLCPLFAHSPMRLSLSRPLQGPASFGLLAASRRGSLRGCLHLFQDALSDALVVSFVLLRLRFFRLPVCPRWGWARNLPPAVFTQPIRRPLHWLAYFLLSCNQDGRTRGRPNLVVTTLPIVFCPLCIRWSRPYLHLCFCFLLSCAN